MFHFGETQLRVVQRTTSLPDNAQLLDKTRALVVGHILPTTEEFIRLLMDAKVAIHALFAKPYSIDSGVLESLKGRGVKVVEETYETLDTSDLMYDELASAIRMSKEDDRRVVLFDIGGYFAKPLSLLSAADASKIAGVVEDTTFGHNRYATAVNSTNGIPVPVYSVARSDLKKIEARFVGRDAVQAVDQMLREVGIAMTGRNALVIGYGMIGQNVARALRNYDLNVYVYDLEDRKLARAFIDGFHIHKKSVLIPSADIIFSATGSEALHGQPAMSLEEMEECKPNVILASVGSRKSEFDVEALVASKPEGTKMSRYLTKYVPMSKPVILANEGTAVNFTLPSIPVEVLDLVFAEILYCAISLLKQNLAATDGEPPLVPNTIYRAKSRELDEIAKVWLRSVNMEAK